MVKKINEPLRYYKLVTNDRIANYSPGIIYLLNNNGFYKENFVQSFRGGRKRDNFIETLEYTLLSSGLSEDSKDSGYAEVYEVIYDESPFYSRHISIIIDQNLKKPISQNVFNKLDEFGFKRSYENLKEVDKFSFEPKFKTWLDSIITVNDVVKK